MALCPLWTKSSWRGSFCYWWNLPKKCSVVELGCGLSNLMQWLPLRLYQGNRELPTVHQRSSRQCQEQPLIKECDCGTCADHWLQDKAAIVATERNTVTRLHLESLIIQAMPDTLNKNQGTPHHIYGKRL